MFLSSMRRAHLDDAGGIPNLGIPRAFCYNETNETETRDLL